MVRPEVGGQGKRALARAAAALAAAGVLTCCTTRQPAEPVALAPAGAPTAATPSALATYVSFDGAPTLAVEVASTGSERERGLMGRRALPAGTGMLFSFPERTTGGFWMKNTLVPLSIAYVDRGSVVSTAEMVPCPPAVDECPTYAATGPYTDAVEAPARFFAEHGVGPGTRVTVTGQTRPPQ